MFLKNAILVFIGLSSGGVIAAGIFAFLAIIGVFPRVIGETRNARHILLCETMLILGGVFGNIVSIYHAPRMFGGQIMLGIWGLSMGVFVGCLVMSLAETLKALPVLCRRIRLSVGLQYVIASVALGKCAGSLIYFLKDFGGT